MPILSNIPLIGKLFTHMNSSVKKTDLLIEITPRIVNMGLSYSDAGNLTSQGYRILDEGKTTNLPALEPDFEDLRKIKSDVQGLKDDQQRITTPLDQRQNGE